MRYPADPPTVDEIIAVMRHTGADRHGSRARAMIVVLWRAGLRVQEALALAEHDLDQRRGSILVRLGKGGRRREVGMDEWGWQQVRPWLDARTELPVGPLFCIIDGPTRGRPWSGAGVRTEFRRLAAQADVRRRFAPHQLRHAHALELAREGVPLNIIQRQLGHVNLGTTSIYLQGIDPEEIITAVRTRRAPMMSASAGLRRDTIPDRIRGTCSFVEIRTGAPGGPAWPSLLIRPIVRPDGTPIEAAGNARRVDCRTVAFMDHLAIPVRDQERSRRFYETYVGLGCDRHAAMTTAS